MNGKRTKKLLCLLWAALLLIQPALAAEGPSAPEGYQSPFSDVQEGQWFYPFVAQMNSRGVIAGYPDGSFRPDDTISAGDAILMVVKAAGSGELPAPEGEHYAAGYVEYAVEQGWLEGEEGLDLTGPISRVEVARLAARALGLTASRTASPFADLDDGLVTALYRKGIMSGSVEDKERSFHPEGNLTRAEVSTIAWRVEEYPDHIFFWSYVLDILEKVPACSYDVSSFVLEGDRMTYTGPGVQADLGIDVSSYQEEINWKAVAGDGIQFAIVRVGGRYYGGGGLYEDRYYRQNLDGAAAAGLETGVYFFSQAVSVEEAIEEAQFLLKLLDGRKLTGPVVFDWENISNAPARTDGVDSTTLTAAANAFCQTVERAGYTPMVYFNQYIAYLLYDLEGVVQYPFWMAHYQTEPGFYYDYQMWQYTDSGSVAGIEGRVDMDLRLVPW